MKTMSGAVTAKPDGSSPIKLLEELTDFYLALSQRRYQLTSQGMYQEVMCQLFDALAKEVGYNIPTVEQVMARRKVKITLS
jgi:hypothetical protein